MNILIIVDVQNDFLPGGALAVPQGGEIVLPIFKLAKDFDLVVATRDWHPYNHMSFEDSGGSWPRHCVRGTWGSTLNSLIDEVADVIISKGAEADREAYSAFEGTRLGLLVSNPYRAHKITVCGLAADYCVPATALGALDYSRKVTVPLHAIRGVSKTTTDAAIDKMVQAGVKIID
jgi:nicotinamidase/pyrazinamidase